MVTEFRERASRMWPLLLFCGAGGGWVAYRMFVAPNEMMIPWFEIRPGNPVAWLALGLAALGAALGLHRMVIAPHRVVIAPHELRFGVRGRKRLDRAEVAGVEHRRGEVLLRLRDREATLRRLELLEDLEGVSLHPGEFRGGGDLPAVVDRWFDGTMDELPPPSGDT